MPGMLPMRMNLMILIHDPTSMPGMLPVPSLVASPVVSLLPGMVLGGLPVSVRKVLVRVVGRVVGRGGGVFLGGQG